MTDIADSAISDEALEAALDEWLTGAYVELEDDAVLDLDEADRLLRAMAGVLRRRAEIEDLVERRIADLKDWRDKQTTILDKRIAHLDRRLTGWMRAQWESTGRKTWKTPNGELKVRERRPRAVVAGAVDPEVLAPTWRTLGMGDAVKVETSLLAGTAKKHVQPGQPMQTTVEVPEGYEAREATLIIDDGSTNPIRRVVPGLVLLVPKDGPEGQTFSAVPS